MPVVALALLAVDIPPLRSSSEPILSPANTRRTFEVYRTYHHGQDSDHSLSGGLLGGDRAAGACRGRSLPASRIAPHRAPQSRSSRHGCRSRLDVERHSSGATVESRNL